MATSECGHKWHEGACNLEALMQERYDIGYSAGYNHGRSESRLEAAEDDKAELHECPLEAHREMHNLPAHLFIEDFQRFCRVCGLTESHGKHVAALTPQETGQ